MKIDEIRDLVHSVPFEPFTLHAAGGVPVHVAHPNFIAMSPTGRTVTVHTLDARSHRLNVPLISQTDVYESGADAPDSSQAA